MEGHDHHCENPVLGDFSVSSPKFFAARVGGKVLKSVGRECEGARFTKNFENLKIFEKFLLKNAIFAALKAPKENFSPKNALKHQKISCLGIFMSDPLLIFGNRSVIQPLVTLLKSSSGANV